MSAVTPPDTAPTTVVPPRQHLATGRLTGTSGQWLGLCWLLAGCLLLLGLSIPVLARQQENQQKSLQPSQDSSRTNDQRQDQSASPNASSADDTPVTDALQSVRPDRLAQIQRRRVINVVAPAGSSVVFRHSGLQHGFGYDLSRELAQALGVRLNFRTVGSSTAALQLVRRGQADVALSSATTGQVSSLGLGLIDLTCGKPDTLRQQGLSALNWTVADRQDTLADRLDAVACDFASQGKLAALAGFYTHRVSHSGYFRATFNQTLTARLPLYRTTFQRYAKDNRLDWHLLVAMGYQESLLDPLAVSPTGVSGLMMLASATAGDLGVADRNDPVQSIEGGARYFRKMLGRFSGMPASDRLFFALASYNMGPNAVDNVRQQVRREGGDPNQWIDTYAWLERNQAANSRYGQCMHYVSRIRAYLETIKYNQGLMQV